MVFRMSSRRKALKLQKKVLVLSIFTYLRQKKYMTVFIFWKIGECELHNRDEFIRNFEIILVHWKIFSLEHRLCILSSPIFTSAVHRASLRRCGAPLRTIMVSPIPRARNLFCEPLFQNSNFHLIQLKNSEKVVLKNEYSLGSPAIYAL